MRKGLNMKMAAMGLVLVSMVACTGKTTTDATCCAANGEGNCPEGTCRKECTNACNTNNQKIQRSTRTPIFIKTASFNKMSLWKR